MTDSKPPKAPLKAPRRPSREGSTAKAPAAKAPPAAAPTPPHARPQPPVRPRRSAALRAAAAVRQQQPYGGVGYQPSMGPRTNALAIVSLVSSWRFVRAARAGIITGHLALGQIKRTGEAGRGLALAGTIIGYVMIG